MVPMGHIVTSLSPRSPGTLNVPTFALIGGRTGGEELGRAAPWASVLALPFEPACDPGELADKAAVFVDACSDAALAVAECARLRASGVALPLLLFTPRPERLRAAGARAGATRVLGLPLCFDEIRDLLERGEGTEKAAPALELAIEQHDGSVALGPGVVLDRVARRLSVLGQEQPISAQKFELLCYLADRPGRAVEPRELVRFGVIRATQVPRLRALIAELRGRLGPASKLITTVPGFGYRLDLPRAVPSRTETPERASAAAPAVTLHLSGAPNDRSGERYSTKRCVTCP
jgi:DNA-binding response OmpR family regulator